MLNKENENFILGFQDLIVSGAGATLLLFLIFAIKIGGNSAIQAIKEENKGGRYEDNVSLINSKNESIPESKMQTVRTVTFELPSDVYNSIKSQRRRAIGGWDLIDYQSDDDKKSVIQQVAYNDKYNTISYILVLEQLKTEELIFQISRNLDEKSKEAPVTIISRIIEGKGLPYQKGKAIGYDGFTECRFSSKPKRRLTDISEIVFMIGDVSSDDCNLFSIR